MTTDQNPDYRDKADADVVANRAAQVITTMGAEIRALKGERDRFRSAWCSARERAQAYGEGILRVVKDREQHQEWLRQAEERAAVPSAAAPPTQAAEPVKQRADLTEAEWAEQERARFERLYTRETVRADLAEKRADTAARDADIYQQRLERLGEGYTRERKRAERAEAKAERLRTCRDATCTCGHTEQRHFEDACLACDCGDYLPPAAAREVIARYQEAVKPAPVDRAAVLLWAADQIDAETRQAKADGVLEPDKYRPCRDASAQMRRLAEAPQPETEAEADLPARLEAVLTERFTELGNPFSAMRRHEQGPDGWPATHPVGPHQVVEVLRELLAAAAPAVVAQPGKES